MFNPHKLGYQGMGPSDGTRDTQLSQVVEIGDLLSVIFVLSLRTLVVIGHEMRAMDSVEMTDIVSRWVCTSDNNC